MRPFHLLILSLAFAGAAVAQNKPPFDAGPEGPGAPKRLKPPAEPVTRESLAERAAAVRGRAARFLLAVQGKDGGWEGDKGPGISALAVWALAGERSVGPQHAAVKRGADFVLRSQRPDGGIYASEGLHKNYETSVALSMLAALKDDSRTRAIANAQKFLKDNQWDEGDGKSIDDSFYGGAGYGRSKRPDLSNTQMMVEALHNSGLSKDDPAYKKALVFISRCQMRGESNDQAFAGNSTDGGFIYTAAGAGESKAGEWEVNGRKEFRSYGSMTYAGFKSMLYCGLSKDDPRVKAAFDWIQRNWTLDHNPNMPEKQSQEGLYYYYHVFARALQAWGQDTVKDQVGREHDWRVELVGKLETLQREDGSFINEEDRWMEGLPALTTSYALLALEAAER